MRERTSGSCCVIHQVSAPTWVPTAAETTSEPSTSAASRPSPGQLISAKHGGASTEASRRLLRITTPGSLRRSETTPPHAASDFKWKDYSPLVFRQLRERFGIDAGSYLLSLCKMESSLRELSSAGKAAATVSSTQFEAAEDAVEYRDWLASRSQDRRAARDRLRHEVTVPLPERGGDFRGACRSAARQLVEETGLRLELVDPTWSTDPTARLHQWAVRWEQKGAQRRQRLSRKQEGELKRVVMAHLKQDWRRRLGETNETYSQLLRPSQSAGAERTSTRSAKVLHVQRCTN